MSTKTFPDLPALAGYFRQELQTKHFILLYAYNGTGKTRLSTAFKDIGKQSGDADTLYFNAFTEDLFSWDNDLDDDRERLLKINKESRFFEGLRELEMDSKIGPMLERYADFSFKIDTDKWEIRFSRNVTTGSGDKAKSVRVDDIKVSRSEENIFLWCFFLAILQLVLDGDEAYRWVKYIYIDDPISSLDEHNAITVASHMVQLLTSTESQIKTVISTHHTLFFNVVSNELKDARKHGKASQYFLSCDPQPATYLLRKQESDTPSFHHVATLAQLHEAVRNGRLYTHHFNMLRAILEKTAIFHGYRHFSMCLKQGPDAADAALHQRLLDVLSHGNHSLYEPEEMPEGLKGYFSTILRKFIKDYPFNPALFPETPAPVAATTAAHAPAAANTAL